MTTNYTNSADSCQQSDNTNQDNKFNAGDFPLDFQRKIASLAMCDAVFLDKVRSVVQPKMFMDDLDAWVYDSSRRFFEQYKDAPGLKNLIIYISKNTKGIPGSLIQRFKNEIKSFEDEDRSGREFVIDHVMAFARHQTLEKALLKSVDKLEEGDYDSIEDIIRKASMVGGDHSEEINDTAFEWSDPTKLPLTPWIYGDKLIRGKVSLLLAPGGAGKTFFTITSGLAMASGQQLLHDHVYNDGPKSVCFWSLEEDSDTLKRRIHAAGMKYNLIGDDDVAKRIFIQSGSSARIRIVKPGTAGEVEADTQKADEIISFLNGNKIDVLIVDPFVKSHAVNENDNGAIDLVVNEWNRIAVEADCAVWLVHHTSKLRGDDANVESARGAKSLSDAVRVAHALNPMSDKCAKDNALENPRAYIRCDCVKSNYGQRTSTPDWYKFESVDLGNGEAGVGVLMPFALESSHDLDACELDMEAFWQDVDATGNRAKHELAGDWIGHTLAQHLGVDMQKPKDKSAVKAKLESMIGAGDIVIVENKKNGRPRKICQRPSHNTTTTNDNTTTLEVMTA